MHLCIMLTTLKRPNQYLFVSVWLEFFTRNKSARQFIKTLHCLLTLDKDRLELNGVYCIQSCSIDWLIHWSIDRRIVWLIDWLIDWLIVQCIIIFISSYISLFLHRNSSGYFRQWKHIQLRCTQFNRLWPDGFGTTQPILFPPANTGK